MPCEHCGQVHAAGVACTPTPTPAQTPTPAPSVHGFTGDQLAAILGRPNGIEALQVLMGGAQADPPPAPEQRQVVNPVRVTATVTEPAPYRFDNLGNLRAGSHDFSTDLIAASRGDAASMERATSWVQAQFVDTADAATLNPNRQRPDMYVDQLDYVTPLWDFVNRGTLTDVTPFVIPKFSSSSGLVGDHTEGTEPTAGTFVATSQTITPTPLSGKAEVTREAWDQGGNPQLSGLIWQQMVREWNEELESATATFLNTLTAATDIALTTGAADEALAAEWAAAMASLQFIRGGHRFRAFAVHIDLYKAFVAARDTTGRQLYPIIGAQNASGTATPRYGSLDLDGVTGVPSWALGSSGVVSANSWLFNPEDVHGWASAPQRLQFEITVKQVEIGIWGYKAFGNTRIDGVRQVTYDPVV